MVTRFNDSESLARAAAERFVSEAAGKERFRVALSGGSTPKMMYRHLRNAAIDWSRIEVFWSDERFVPPGHPESNEGMARRELLDHLPIPPEQVHGIFGAGSPEECAQAYERRIREFDGVFDLVLLGMGSDGHTASLFPGDPSVEERIRWVMPSLAPVGIPQRITFTLPLVARARGVLIMIAGEDKRHAWQRIEAGERLPTRVVIDEAPFTTVYLASKINL